MQQALRFNERDPAWMAVAISIVISILLIVTDDLINSDGVLYIEATQKMLSGDWVGGAKHYVWPLYSLLIAIVGKITFLGAENSAYVLNVFLQALLVFAFVRCAQALGGSNRVAFFAAILMLTSVSLQGYRGLISRDFGYWAFLFLALYFFLQYYKTNVVKYALGFSISMVIATLFRIEGIVFLFTVPLFILFLDGDIKQKIWRAMLLLSPVILLVVIGLFLLFFTNDGMSLLGRLTDPFIYIQMAYENIFSGTFSSDGLLQKDILVTESNSLASILAEFSSIIVLKFISAIGYVSLVFFIIAYSTKSIRSEIVNLKIVNGFAALNILILIVFTLSRGFLSTRYAMPLALLLMLPAAFALSSFMANIAQSPAWKKRAQILTMVVLAYMFLDGVTSFGASKNYIKESGQWLSNNMSEDARLGASSRTLYYYSNRLIDTNAVATISIGLKSSRPPIINDDDYDYLAVKINRKKLNYEKILTDRVGHKPDFRTSNERGDTVVIYKLR